MAITWNLMENVKTDSTDPFFSNVVTPPSYARYPLKRVINYEVYVKAVPTGSPGDLMVSIEHSPDSDIAGEHFVYCNINNATGATVSWGAVVISSSIITESQTNFCANGIMVSNSLRIQIKAASGDESNYYTVSAAVVFSHE
jgi:hypothetical protein